MLKKKQWVVVCVCMEEDGPRALQVTSPHDDYDLVELARDNYDEHGRAYEIYIVMERG